VTFTSDPKDYLPHREPFLLLDTIIRLEPGVTATAEWTVPRDADYFRGHFPGRPVTPGVLLVEAIAQCGALAVRADERYATKLPLFGGIELARFRRAVAPGDLVILECTMTRLSARGGKGYGTASVNGEIAAEASLLFVVVDE